MNNVPCLRHAKGEGAFHVNPPALPVGTDFLRLFFSCERCR